MSEPFGVGNVMGTGFRVWARNFIPFNFITAVIYVPLIVWATHVDYSDKDSVLYFGLGTIALTLTLNVLVAATITYGVVMELQGKRASIGACISIGFQRLLPAIGVGILTSLAIVFGLFLVLVGAATAACMLYVATPACVIEKPGLMGALRRSRDLTQGYKGQIFGILLLFIIIKWVAQQAIAVAFPMTAGHYDAALYANLGLGIILGSLSAVTAAVAYYYLRNEKEGTSASELAAVFE